MRVGVSVWESEGDGEGKCGGNGYLRMWCMCMRVCRLCACMRVYMCALARP